VTEPADRRSRLADPAGGAGGLPRGIDAIEPLITQLVQSAPALDPAVVAALIEQLDGIGAPLARAIAGVVGLVAEHRIDAGIALPPLAMACATLTAGLRGELTQRELEAARYEIETLLPLPAPAPVIAAPDVPLTALRRRTP
jgi:hypothetical protein